MKYLIILLDRLAFSLLLIIASTVVIIAVPIWTILHLLWCFKLPKKENTTRLLKETPHAYWSAIKLEHRLSKQVEISKNKEEPNA